MNLIFEHLIDGGHIVVYLDDILIFMEDTTSLSELTDAVLRVLERHDLYLKPEKCTFAQTSIEYLGIVISNGQVSMDPAKVAGIAEWPTPHTLKELQAFLGLCNFYQWFIENYSTIARPLFDLTKKDTRSSGMVQQKPLFEPSSEPSPQPLFWPSLTTPNHSASSLTLVILLRGPFWNNPMHLTCNATAGVIVRRAFESEFFVE